MEFKMTKRRKMFFSLFIVLLIAVVTAGTVAAVDYSQINNPDVLEHLNKKGFWNSIGRDIKYDILKGIAKIIDYFDDAISQLMKINLYDIVGDNFPNLDMAPIAWAILSFVVVLIGLMFIIYPDKLKISDTLRNVIISAALIVALPSFLSALGDLRTKGIDAVNNISVSSGHTDNEGQNYGLGNDLLSSKVMDLNRCSDNQMHYYSDNANRNGDSIYHLDFTSVLSNDVWDKEPVQKGTYISSQYKFSELDTDKMMTLLGLYPRYALFKQVKTYNERTNKSNEEEQKIIDVPADEVENNGVSTNDDFVGPACVFYTTEQYEKFLINQISKNDIVEQEGKTDSVLACKYIEDALDSIKDTAIKKLNIEYNKTVQGGTANYDFIELLNKDRYESLSWYKQIPYDIGSVISGGDPLEYLFAYDVNFFETFLTMLVVAICLFFSGFKLASLIYDVFFMQIIAPVVIATDMNGSTRAKKMINELLVTFVIFIVVALDLKLYIIILNGIFKHIDNFLVQIFLILAGAKFVIDGPDIIVKLTGIDAGVKSGAATLMGIHSGMQTASSVATNVTNGAKALAAAPSKAANSISNAAHKVKDAICGDDTKKNGQAFNNAQSGEKGGEKGSQSTAENSGSSKDGAKDGENTGGNTKDGQNGQQVGAGAGKAGENGSNGSAGEKGAGGHGFNEGSGSSSSGDRGQGFNNTTESQTSNHSSENTYAERQKQSESNGFAQQEAAAEPKRETYHDIQKNEEDKE